MTKKITGPGLFRLLLAAIVVVHHFTRLSFGSGAVFVFFSLSGFWIFRMYSQKYSVARRPYVTYLISRLWRLIPTFWVVSLLTFAFIILRGDIWKYLSQNRLHLATSSLLIYGYESLKAPPIVPAWSLDIEMQFYLLAPLLAVVLMRRKVNPLWVLGAVCSVSALSAATGNRIPFFSYLVFFVLGMVASSPEWRPSRKLVVWLLGIELMLIVSCLISPWRGVLLVGAHRTSMAEYNTCANVVLAILTIPYAIFTTKQKGTANDAMLGDISYVVYLLHWMGALYLGKFHDGGLQKLERAAWVCCLITGLSVMVWKYCDKPLNEMRARWVSQRIRDARSTSLFNEQSESVNFPALQRSSAFESNGRTE